MRHCLVSTCNLRLLKDHQRVALEKSLRNCITWRALCNILALKYCGQTASELHPLFRGPTVKERYG
eukprot:6604136-Ditylum_brightwellii.AAC.1